ncbi:MAG TPA: histidine kinase [Thermoanaerobaculia bacterium]
MHHDQGILRTSTRQLGRTLASFWLLYSVFRAAFETAVLRSAGEPVPYLRLSLTTLLQSAIWTGVSWLLFRGCNAALSLRRPFVRRLAFLGTIAGTWALRLLCYACTDVLLRKPLTIDGASFVRALQAGAIGVAVFTVVLAGTVVGMSWWQRQLQAARHRAESEGVLVRAELRVLAEQLEPHFLLNTLTGISALAENDAAAAREMLAGLQDLLAYSIRHGAAATVSLADEVRFVRQYLRLQSLRFGARLRSRIAIPPDLLACLVPRLILQPLVENALKYGIAHCEEGGEIVVDAERGIGALMIRVRNSSSGAPASPGMGIGLAAVRARLALLFGNSQQVTLTEDGSGSTVVTVVMPLVTTVRKKGAAA